MRAVSPRGQVTHAASRPSPSFAWRSSADARVRGEDRGAVFVDVVTFGGSRHKILAEEVEFLDRRREGREGEEDR